MSEYSPYKTLRGFSLVELLVALVIGLMLTAGIGSMFVSTKESNLIQSTHRKILDNSRFAVDMIASELRRSGYWGGNLDPSAIGGTAGRVAVSDTCSATGTTWARMIEQPLYGLDDTNLGYACILNTDYLRGDILTVRYASESTAGTLLPDRLYLRASIFEGRIFAGSDTDSNLIGDTPRSTRALVSRAFYVGPSSEVCRPGVPIPSLYIKAPGDDGLPTTIEQVIGVEHLQFQYGLDTDADGSIEHYVDADAVVNWADVTAVRFWLLFRAECPDPDFIDRNRYALGDQIYSPNDNFRRRLHSLTVALRN